jgi:hypothetical protein
MALIKGQEVNYLAPSTTAGGKPSVRKGVIIEVRVQPSARTTGLALVDHSADGEPDGQHTALATYDPSGTKENSFHLESDKAANRQSGSDKSQPAAAASAINGSSK